MRIYNEPIEVEPTTGPPRSLRWRRRLIRVEQVLDCWVFEGKWWRRPERRVYLRLLTDRGVFEVYRMGSEWRMGRVVD